MNFMSYVVEVSRGWDEPNARDMGRMMSQPNAKGEMYILNDGIDMKAEIAAMERRLDELEMNQMQPVQAISQTPLQAMPCAICLSYEHLVEECPTIPAEREMFGDCNTYNSNWRNHPKFSWKPQPPQYKQYAQAPQQASILEQAMANLSKVMGDFIGKQEATNARLDQRMDGMQNDMAQNGGSRGESSMVKEIEEVITLRSGKEVDLPTCKLEHKRTTEDSHQGRIDEETHASTFSPSFVWENHTNQAPSFWMIKIKRNCKEIEEKNRSKIGVKRRENRGKTGVYEISQPLRNRHFVAKPFRNTVEVSAKIFAVAKPILAHECHFAAQEHLFRSCETHCEVKKADFATKVPFRKGFRGCESTFGTRVPFCSTVTLISQLRNGCEVPKCEKSQFHSRTPFRQLLDTFRSLSEVQIMHAISRWKAWEVRSP
ncbi:hypothetical protein CK203_028284 [Vitis vinifera]|uniref:Uncharacterized protein n=1 Tax=Vitis vinifera TaxID=29760 RepID=A0A438IZY6_VITVI|nr:hypothetical protein CK203_028284 [Vitis vinifera]